MSPAGCNPAKRFSVPFYCRFPCAPASILERNRPQLPAKDPAVKIQGSTLFVLIKGDLFRARLDKARGSKKVHGRKIGKGRPRGKLGFPPLRDCWKQCREALSGLSLPVIGAVKTEPELITLRGFVKTDIPDYRVSKAHGKSLCSLPGESAAQRLAFSCAFPAVSRCGTSYCAYPGRLHRPNLHQGLPV